MSVVFIGNHNTILTFIVLATSYWAGRTTTYELIGFIKRILNSFQLSELKHFTLTVTTEERRKILRPEPAVSRTLPVPAVVGWWSNYIPENIIAVDCEMVSYIIGHKNNRRPRCQQKAATVSVCSYNGEVIRRFKIKPDNIPLPFVKYYDQ